MHELKLILIVAFCLILPIGLFGHVRSDSTNKRDPISVTQQEATTLKDAYTQAQMAQLIFENAVLKIKNDHGIPPDYLYNVQAGRFEPPPPKPEPSPSPSPSLKP